MPRAGAAQDLPDEQEERSCADQRSKVEPERAPWNRESPDQQSDQEAEGQDEPETTWLSLRA